MTTAGEYRAAAQPPPVGVLMVRLSAYDPRARRHLESYARGVAEMKRRSDRNPADPVGWTVQAAIHGGQIPNRPDIECQHAVWWFLPWHRAYL